MTNYLKDILLGLADAKIKFIVCGGVAVVLHGVERMTLDLDLSVDMSRKNIQNLLTEMKRQKLIPRAPVPPETLLDSSKLNLLLKKKMLSFLRLIPIRQVDIFVTRENDFRSLNSHITEIDLEGRRVQVVSKQKLIEMKKEIQPPMDKDLWDIKELGRL
jgi:hypothetical protein